jgi:hypothetical protein
MSAGRITRIEIMPLPRWARLALAARCLRRARDLVRPAPAHAAILDRAISQIEESAAAAHPAAGLADSAAAAYSLALDNLDLPTPETPDAGDREVVTCMVAHAAAFAAEAATMVDAHRAAHLVSQSVDFVVHAFRLSGTAEAAAALADIRADLERLWAAEPNWGDETPVPASFFTT